MIDIAVQAIYDGGIYVVGGIALVLFDILTDSEKDHA